MAFAVAWSVAEIEEPVFRELRPQCGGCRTMSGTRRGGVASFGRLVVASDVDVGEPHMADGRAPVSLFFSFPAPLSFEHDAPAVLT